jgi:hypothetical protein
MPQLRLLRRKDIEAAEIRDFSKLVVYNLSRLCRGLFPVRPDLRGFAIQK